jgi:SAM-dependent methyltransferase
LREADLNQLTDVFKWYDPEWKAALDDLKGNAHRYEPPDFIHRKAWEWGHCMYGLQKLGMLQEPYSALGVGVGWEPISFALSNLVGNVVATDLYDDWGDARGREGNPDILDDPDRFAPFQYRRDRLRFARMDGTELEFDDESFDIVWSCSSIEHFGGHEGASRSMREMERVLKPGGVLALITEYVMPDGFDENRTTFHPEFFNLHCLYDYLIMPVPHLRLVQDVDFSLPSYYVRRACEYPEEAGAPHEGINKPHVVLSKDRALFTSLALFFRKAEISEATAARIDTLAGEEPIALPDAFERGSGSLPGRAAISLRRVLSRGARAIPFQPEPGAQEKASS